MIPINFSINVGMERTISYFVNISSPVVVVSFGFCGTRMKGEQFSPLQMVKLVAFGSMLTENH